MSKTKKEKESKKKKNKVKEKVKESIANKVLLISSNAQQKNKLDGIVWMNEEKEIPITYGLIKATCGWSEFAEVTNRNVYTVKAFGDYEANEVFYITESQAKQLNFN